MVTFSFNIPIYRIKVSLASKRRGHRDLILSILDEITKVRNGSKISRIARHVISRAKISRILGANLMGLVILTNTVIPSASSALAEKDTEVVSLAAREAPVETVIARQYPVKQPIIITQGYHFFHQGIDIDGVTGDPIYPIMNGQVEAVENEFILGKTIKVAHEGGYISIYAHLDTIAVKTGQEVNTNTKLGEMGNTGRSFGDHVHLEVVKDGRHINPKTVLPPR